MARHPQEYGPENLSLLQEENRQLRDQLRALEELIAQNNLHLLATEMSHMELEQVFNACVDPMYLIRADGTVLRANSKMLELLKKPEDEVVGQPCNCLNERRDCDRENCRFLHTAHTGISMEADIDWGSTAEGLRNYIQSISALITLDGTPGILIQYKDITERKEAEQALNEAHAQMEKLARTDGLTGIANRRTFDEDLRREWLRLRREQLPLSLLLMDIDYFKKYNDSYGHQQGDHCLQQVAATIAATLRRPADLAARYGGEEFAVLLPNTTQRGGEEMARRILEAIHDLALPHRASEVDERVTLSIGLASTVPSVHDSSEQLLKRADEALYASKEQGRKRYSVAPSPSAPQPDESGNPSPE